MSTKNSSSGGSPDPEKTPLILDGVSQEDVTKGLLCEIHRAADEEGLSLENISVVTR